MRAESRKRLAASQAELVRALALQEPPPDGFDNWRVAAASDALIGKRARSVAHAWPALANALGENFNQRFADHARATPIPPEGGPLADGRAFARMLARAGEFPDEAKIERLAVDARYDSRSNGFIARRGFTIKAALLKQQRCVAVVIRLPMLGERWLKLQLPGAAITQQTSPLKRSPTRVPE